jgi:hypothetical protein
MAGVLVLTMVATACAQPTPDDAAGVEADHVNDDSHPHDEGEAAADDHAHDDDGLSSDDHGHDDEAAGIDHHGNPIFDESERVYEKAGTLCSTSTSRMLPPGHRSPA